tara:strand:+ start:879 stop:1286 length:408 start_codon:yes stop_codon:yes gene_type:complete
MLKIEIKSKRTKINIIPLIDIIFLMLVFFMLATNFSKNHQISFSVLQQKEVNNVVADDKVMIIYLRNNKIIYQDKELSTNDLESNFFKKWGQQPFDKIVILNDKKTKIQLLINLLDLIKRNKIINVSFSDDKKKN